MFFLQARYRGRTAGQFTGDDIRGQRYHADTANLGYQRHSTGRPGVSLKHVHLAVFNGILHIHKTYHVHLYCNLAGIFFNGLQVFFGNLTAWQDAGTVTGMDACQFNMFHNRRYEGILAVGNGIRLAFQRIVEEPVNEDGTVRGYADGCCHVILHLIVVVNHFHAPAS